MPASATLDQFYPLNGIIEAQADWLKMANLFRNSGVVRNVSGADLNEFLTTQRAAGANMSVDVASGRGWIAGSFAENGSVKNLTVAAADLSNPRIDRVVLSLLPNTPSVVVQVYTGTAATAGTQVPPPLVRSGTQWDLSLYQIAVAAGAATIVTANLLDERQWSTGHGFTVTPTVAAAAALPVPVGVSATYPERLLVPVSGTTTITSLPVAPAGSEVVLAFQGAITLNTANNLHLARTLVTTAACTLALYSDGSQWWELARANEAVSANTALLGPTSGGATQPTQRALVDADVPKTLTGMTLTAPTIGDLSNAQHAHAAGSSGGLVDHTSLTSKGMNSHAGIDTHIGASTAHGALSALVGKDDTVTLTNKTLTAPVITGGSWSAGSATNALLVSGDTSLSGATAGDALVARGTGAGGSVGVRVTQGGLDITGLATLRTGATITSGGADVTGASIQRSGLTILNTLLASGDTVLSGANAGEAIVARGASATQRGLRVSQGGIDVSNDSIFNQVLTVTGQATLNGGAAITGTATVGGATITTNTATQTLTNKTLTAPTIGDLSNMQHAHTGASSGGTLSLTPDAVGIQRGTGTSGASPVAVGALWQSSVSVTFGSAFAATPRVFVTALNATCSANATSVNTAGCVVSVLNTSNAGNVPFNWEAVPA